MAEEQDNQEQLTADDEVTEPTVSEETGEEVSDDQEADDGEFDRERALAKIRKQNQENRALRQKAKQHESRASESETRASTLEAENLRLKVALDLGLPATVATRLQGDSREELIEDAEELLSLFEAKTPPTNQPKASFKAGAPSSVADEVGNLDDFAARIHAQ